MKQGNSRFLYSPELFYLPDGTLDSYVYFISPDVIRVYLTDHTPHIGETIDYCDYFTNFHYSSLCHTTTLTEELDPDTRISNDRLTSNWWNRNDITDILICFTLIVGCIWFLVSKLIKTFFRGVKLC